MAAQRSLKDPSLLIGKCLINGKWVESQSGARFNVYGQSLSCDDFITLAANILQIPPPSSSSGPARSPPNKMLSPLLTLPPVLCPPGAP